MLDLTDPPADPTDIEREALPTTGSVDFRLIELFFFAYREFTADADELLAQYGFGRAHHRILHFVNRAPGMTIAEILDLLQITKQSLSRVLRQLVEEGFIAILPGDDDRRQRLLFPTARGRELTLELSRAQARRIDLAMAGTGQRHSDSIHRFLRLMGQDGEATREWFARQGIVEDERR
ncbi:MarR family winged helix-turn-helix transcriptional regulator [Aureimonas altamirensis]|uniref:Transcriptional regulator, MarR family n=1 Tax=Aureimonas altamirensis DSM 21988 TaxID=1121026 RepID=A0ABY1IGS6_9HYPH|nr:transcriptional regulator, MarR family [Aureimonas altamirensis DSM 21988]